MHVDMGMRFSMNFLELIGSSIGMPMEPGNKFFENFCCLEFGCTENSWEMLDQYY